MKQHKLLLADDSITIQKVVNLTFADEGIEVISADNGDTALELFHERAPDLVMIDVNMPGLNGYELCEYIKTNELSKNVPVILLVGSFEPFNQTRARQAKADDYMTKPFQSIRELVNKVSELLPDKKSEQTVADSYVDSEMDTMEYDAAELVTNEENTTEKIPDAAPMAAYPLDETGKFEYRHQTNDQIESDDDDAYEVQAGDDFQITESSPEIGTIENKQTESNFMFDLDDTDFLELPPIAKVTENDVTEVNTNQSFQNNVEEFSPSIKTAESEFEPQAEEPTSGKTDNKLINLHDFSPEVIDAIAEKVVEKLTARMKE